MYRTSAKDGFLAEQDMLLLDTILHRPDRVHFHLLHSLEMDHVHLSNGTFSILLLTINEYGMDITKSKRHEDETSNDLYMHVGSILHKHLQNRFVHYLMMTGGRLLCLISIPQREAGKGHWKRMVEQLRVLCERANAECLKTHGGDFTVMISYPRIGPENLSAGYQATLDMLAYYDFIETQIPFAVEEDSGSVLGSYNRDFLEFQNAAKTISAHLRIHDVAAAKSGALSSLLTSLMEFPHSMDAVRMRTVTFSTVLIQQLMTDGIVTREQIQHDKMLQELTTATTKTDLLNVVQEFLDAVEAGQIQKKDNSDEVLIEQICQYISENLCDMNLNVSMLALKFHLSQSMLSSKFKKYCGECLTDHIAKARLERAKQLLEGTQLSLEEIAAQAGFGSLPTLYRAFRKYEKLSPGSYRKNTQER